MTEWKKYWDEELETMPHDKLERLETEKLQEMVAWAYERSALYKRKFDRAGVKPEDIKTREDIRKLPLTTYFEDFCQTTVADKLAVPEDEVKVFSNVAELIAHHEGTTVEEVREKLKRKPVTMMLEDELQKQGVQIL